MIPSDQQRKLSAHTKMGKVLAATKPESNPREPHGEERTNSSKLSSDPHTHVHNLSIHVQISFIKFVKNLSQGELGWLSTWKTFPMVISQGLEGVCPSHVPCPGHFSIIFCTINR